MSGSSSMYRADIDGLRAVAVIAVVLFHARLPGVAGGFVGVDVFFVISGYLITRLLLADLDAKRFSIVTFYERRVRRIFPALFAVLAVSAGVGAIVLMPEDLAQFGQSLLATTFFLANQFFLSLSGYFDSAAETKPLLHMWSLAVEEQFYVLFPLALWAAHRFVHRRIVALTWATWIGSLLLGLWMVRAYPEAAFYLAPPRAWELLTGSLLAMGAIPAARNGGTRNIMALVGGVLILWAVAGFTRTTTFPGLAALLPCLGAGLIIHAGSGGSTVVGRLLSWRPMTLIGLMSYSLYLWHWPLLVFAEYSAADPLTQRDRLLVMVLALAVSYLSWHYVEGPFRGRTSLLSGRRAILTFGGWCMASGAALAAVLIASRGLPERFDAGVMDLARVRTEGVNFVCDSVAGVTDIPFARACQLGASDAPRTFVLWGDSHALQYAGQLSLAADSMGLAGVLLSLGNCQPLLGVSRLDQLRPDDCPQFNQDAVAYIRRTGTVRHVLIAGIWAVAAEESAFAGEARGPFLHTTTSGRSDSGNGLSAFDRGLAETVDSMVALARDLVIVGPTPELGWDAPVVLEKSLAYRRPPPQPITRAAFLTRQARVLTSLTNHATRDGVHVIAPYERLCGVASCRYVDSTGSLYFDSNHLSAAGVRHVLPLLLAPLEASPEPSIGGQSGSASAATSASPST